MVDPAPRDAAERMRSDWDARAREDAAWYIAAAESRGIHFELSGLRDAFQILEDLHPHLRADMRVLEIGCGIGRLMQYLAVVFAEVHGIDVSPEMVARARERLARFPNAHPIAGDGRSLRPYADASFDLIVSHVVFQHVPEKEIVRSYVAEARRVLRPGGIFKYLVKTGPWKADEVPDTWVGASLAREDIEAWNRELGFELLAAYSPPSPPATAWIVVRAPADA